MWFCCACVVWVSPPSHLTAGCETIILLRVALRAVLCMCGLGLKVEEWLIECSDPKVVVMGFAWGICWGPAVVH